MSWFSRAYTHCSYFIPEDGDLEDRPNVFLAPKPRQQGYPPSLGQVKSSFPLPGRYHFRFKSPLQPGTDREKHAMPVWMDCIDDRQPVPTWRAMIVAKVTRIGVEEDDMDDDDEDEDFRRPTPPPQPQATPQQQRSQQQQQQQPNLDIFGGSAATSSGGSHRAATNLLDGHAPQQTQSEHGSGDLLGGMHGHAGSHQNYSGGPAAAGDLLGMSTPSPPVSGNNAGYGQYGRQQQQQQQQHQQGGPFF